MASVRTVSLYLTYIVAFGLTKTGVANVALLKIPNLLLAAALIGGVQLHPTSLIVYDEVGAVTVLNAEAILKRVNLLNVINISPLEWLEIVVPVVDDSFVST